MAHPYYLSLTLLAAATIAAGCEQTVQVSAPTAERKGEPSRDTLTRQTTSTPGAACFIDVTAATGINFQHTDGGGSQYLVATVAAGVALFDYNNDGFADIYFLNGAPAPGADPATLPTNALYRNNGDWTFTDVTAASGTGDVGFGLGVVAADYDNDGDQDLYVSNFGPNVLYRNNGDGTFTNVTAAAGVASDRYGAGVAFVDVDNDGHLDLYVANYVSYKYSANILESIGPHQHPAGPAYYPLARDQLFRNNGDGTFKDISKSSGVDSLKRAGMGLVCADVDDDDDTDIFVGSDVGGNLLLQNDGTGRFTDVALASGIAYDGQGKDNGSMGASCADFDGDGQLDIVVTTFNAEDTVLFRNLGGGVFTDVSARHPAFKSTHAHVTWGAALADFDHDTDRDLYLACGYLYQAKHLHELGTAYKCSDFYFENRDSVFVDASARSGPGLGVSACSKGAAFDDLDNDGDLDAVILNMNGPPTILRNDLETSRHSVQISLRGKQANRDGAGARITVVTADKKQIAEVHRGQGYQSSYGQRVHFGLGEIGKARKIIVRWPGGDMDTIDNPQAAKFLLIHQGGKVETVLHQKETVP